MQVTRLSFTPVKGTALHHPSSLRIEPHGVPGNRRFLFIDPKDVTYDSVPLAPLMPVVATHDDEAEVLTMQLPDGSSLEGSTAASGDPTEIDLWGRTLMGHLIDGPWNARITELVGMQLQLVKIADPSGGSDQAPVTFVSEASLAALGARLDAPPVDGARFRMTFDLDGVDADEEDTWGGRLLSIGDVQLRVTEQVPRCVVTTWNPQTGIRDFHTLKAIYLMKGRIPDGLPFGMYAEVEQPGTISVGDEITLLD